MTFPTTAKTALSLLPLVLLAAASLSGAAPATPTTATPTTATTAKTIRIEMSEMKFAPMNLTLRAGQPVVIQLSNAGVAPHEFQAYGKPGAAPKGEAAWDAYMEKHTIWLPSRDTRLTVNGKAVKGRFIEVQLKPGEKATLSFTPTQAGAFEMACDYPGHYESGMKGPLTVR
ncbi:cupredoxin domain-containing protein [Deinococcus koreensis]|uniref:EfeO-type cupredoxin-like domain-containing protein n=1 Tax=Deinococcus koreensis TaxID=2054903 RepID=A0A2K3UWF5_9DEIO|nr:cupredoxin domain-containing protein [Deinococcus koreensis]PNY80850.1 hypothetical protein CVO96_05235 [Deinococcus koreensis]